MLSSNAMFLQHTLILYTHVHLSLFPVIILLIIIEGKMYGGWDRGRFSALESAACSALGTVMDRHSPKHMLGCYTASCAWAVGCQMAHNMYVSCLRAWAWFELLCMLYYMWAACDGMCMYKAMGRPWAGLHVGRPGGVAPALLPTLFYSTLLVCGSQRIVGYVCGSVTNQPAAC